MKLKKENLLLYAVTDRREGDGNSLYQQVEQALKGGVTCVQLREKNLAEDDFIKEALQIRDLCHRYEVPLIINDNLNVAVKSGADGIHVGQEDMPVAEIRKQTGSDFIIGATAKTPEQAKRAWEEGADYLGVGAVFPSPTKQNAIRITKEALREITASVEIPVVAIGGICRDNLDELKGCGISGIALSSGIFATEDITKECRGFRKELKVNGIPAGESGAECNVNNQKTAGEHSDMKSVLTIAGSDSGGGAGIQADIKTMTMHGVFATTAITALTAQNTTGVRSILDVTPKFLAEQMDAVFEDIFPAAVKIGMVSSAALIHVIAEKLKAYQAVNIVVDPVMVATSGAGLLQKDAVATLKEELIPLACVVTPNIPEAEILSGTSITTKEEMEQAAAKIGQEFSCAVLLKGGHSICDANDLLYTDGHMQWIYSERINNPNTHGTGCTLSSAIACGLAKGKTLVQAVEDAKTYINGALAAGLDLGAGSGPLNHMFACRKFWE